MGKTKKPPPNPAVGNGAGRERNGRFAKGNPGGPGCPPSETKRLRETLLSVSTDKDLGDVFKTLLHLAKAGDVEAAKVVLARAYGAKTHAGMDYPPHPDLAAKVREARTVQTFASVAQELLALQLAGMVDDDRAERLLQTVTMNLKVLELLDLEQRLAEIERKLEQGG